MAADLSVVICSLNGAAGLDRCLRALATQEGPAELEIIVVDDGSTDDTSGVGRAHGATVIRHATNLGLAAARNSGVRAASAPIVAFLDDDCEPEPQWAQGLLEGYEDDVVGVGGVVLPYAGTGYMLGYLRRHNPLRPLEVDLALSNKLLYRLYLYLRRQWMTAERHDRREVYSLVGANMSFRRSPLHDTGFDERFHFGGEDFDLCRRLAGQYPARLIVTPDASVKHHFRPTLSDTLRRSRAYGRGSARLFRKWPPMRPTFFPGPILVAATVVVSIWFPVLLIAAVILPHLLYPQGVRYALTRRRPACLLDAYLELAREASADVGFVEGLWRFRRLTPEPRTSSMWAVELRQATAVIVKQGSIAQVNGHVTGRYKAAISPWKPLAPQFAGLALLAALTPLHRLWAAQVLLVPLLLIVPGLILLRALRVPGRAVASFPVYVPCASLIVLLASGLAVDLTGPLIGIAAPLRTVPLLVGLELIGAVLLASSVNASPAVEIPWGPLSRPIRLMWPLILPLVAAAGALRLNNGGANTVAVIALSASIAVVLWAIWLAPKLDKATLAVIVYAVGLGMMWSFSLRGNLVYGSDIASEYHAMQETILNGIWHPAHPGDAYGAMLSVTVLPTELHALSGLSGLLVLKVVFPLIGALFPVAVFSLACRVLARRWSFISAGFVVMQATFFQEFPALARQEISMPLFAALVAALLASRLSRSSQWTLVGLLGLGVVVSHYSTTYLAIPLLGLTVGLQWIASWFLRVPRFTAAFLVGFVVILGGAFLWYGRVTQSTANVSEFISAMETQGISILPNHGGDLLSTYLRGELDKQFQPAQYAQIIHDYYATHLPFVKPLPNAGQPQYALQNAPTSNPQITLAPTYNALNLIVLLIQQLTNVLAAVGALLIILQRRAPVIARQVALLALAALVILTVTRLSGTLAQFYNPERAFLQMMVVLAITLCWPLQGLPRRWRGLQPVIVTVAAGSLAVFFASAGGLLGAVFNAGTATNLANSGTDYQQFYMTTPELVAASWVGKAAPAGQLIYADPYGQLRLLAENGYRPGVLSDITPLTLDQHAWIYATRTNIVDKTVRASLGNGSVTYAFPERFLDLNYDTVYTNGSSEVFHR